MTSVTHGADAERLREIAGTMRGQGARVQEVGDQLGPLSAMLQEAWGGPDAEHLLSQVEMLRPSVANTGATLVAWADGLHAQADQQAAGSGEGGGAGGSVTRGDIRDGVRRFAGLTGKLSAPTSGESGPSWQDGSPLANSATAYQHSTDGGGGGVSDIDGERPAATPGRSTNRGASRSPPPSKPAR